MFTIITTIIIIIIVTNIITIVIIEPLIMIMTRHTSSVSRREVGNGGRLMTSHEDERLERLSTCNTVTPHNTHCSSTYFTLLLDHSGELHELNRSAEYMSSTQRRLEVAKRCLPV